MQNESNSSERVAVLVDSANIFKTSVELGVRVDYERILERLNGGHILRSIVYHVEVDREREAGFLHKIRAMGYEVRTKELRVYPDGKTKADMDVDITIDAVCLSDKVDVLCLVSGDGDYVPLVHYLRSRGVRVEAMAFERCASQALKEAVDRFSAIGKDMLLDPESWPQNSTRMEWV
jgi:uncharacterized LabA/DUF88 family protein